MANAPRFIEVNGVELNRMTQAAMGTRAAARWAQTYAQNKIVQKALAAIVVRHIKALTPVRKSNDPSIKGGSLQKSIKAFTVGSRIEYYWLWYGNIIVKGNPDHMIYAQAGMSSILGTKGRMAGRPHAKSLRFIGASGFPVYRPMVHKAAIAGKPFVQGAIREAMKEFMDLDMYIGLDEFRLIKEVYPFSVDDDLDRLIMSGHFGDISND